jgi:hypothetical protein
MKQHRTRWLRTLSLGVLGGTAIVVAATLATLGTAPFVSAQGRIISIAADLRWSRLPPERLDRLRDQALATAFDEREKWLGVRQHVVALPLVCDRVYSRTEPSIDGATFETISETELQSRADDAGVYWSYHVSSPEFSWAQATVWVSYQQHFARGSDLLDLGSRAVKLVCVPDSSRWRCAVSTWVIA